MARLRAELLHELADRQRLARELVALQAELLSVRAELEGTRAEESQARHLSRHDGLTALPNAGFFRERIESLLNGKDPQRQAMAVLYIDLDGFKRINDVHGHAVGDEVLRIVAARLARSVRAEDLVGRLGGDEFACLLTQLPSLDQLSQLACKLFDAVALPMKIGSLDLTVRASIGISTYPAHGTTAAKLLNSADAAMYGAKRVGSGYAFCEDAEKKG
jgi:diguanylate cyclase (GGDEF)-like protein